MGKESDQNDNSSYGVNKKSVHVYTEDEPGERNLCIPRKIAIASNAHKVSLQVKYYNRKSNGELDKSPTRVFAQNVHPKNLFRCGIELHEMSSKKD